VASSSESQSDGSAGLFQFGLGMAASFGVIAVGVLLLAVSLPDGLKFVLATFAGMLTMVCIGIGYLVGQRARG
jgi:hypothetical protein